MLLNHPFNDSFSGACLVAVDDKRRFDLNDTDTFIGRSKENDISLVSDLSLSRRHASITRVEGVFYLRDLRSSNGTLLNGQTVDGIVALHPDDEIFLGRTRFLFCPTSRKLESVQSYISDADTTILRPQSPTTATRFNNFLNVFNRFVKPAQAKTEIQKQGSIQNVRASHTNELLKGVAMDYRG